MSATGVLGTLTTDRAVQGDNWGRWEEDQPEWFDDEFREAVPRSEFKTALILTSCNVKTAIRAFLFCR